MKNDALNNALQEYATIETNYIKSLQEKGLVFGKRDALSDECKMLRSKLAARGVNVRNAGASLSVGHLSPACVGCTGAGGSETFSTTFKCHRDCYFCFNKNLPDYQHFFDSGCPWQQTFERCTSENDSLACIGITGGEPLLDLNNALELLKRCQEVYPSAHKRMYTSGNLLTEESARALRDAGLDEIRFSVKDDDSPEQQAKVLAAMRLSKKYIPSVMVEMPIIPGAEQHMKHLLLEFDKIGIDGINMLEFCFPFSNWEEFSGRGFVLKNPPFEVMYDYGYSGGLAVEGSELLILKLMNWSLDEGLTLGMHYCSLENKHRSEIRIKNERIAKSLPMLTFDENDFFLKAAKVFGSDVPIVKDALTAYGCTDLREDTTESSLVFPLAYIDKVFALCREDGQPVEPKVCYFVYECNDDDAYLIDIALK